MIPTQDPSYTATRLLVTMVAPMYRVSVSTAMKAIGMARRGASNPEQCLERAVRRYRADAGEGSMGGSSWIAPGLDARCGASSDMRPSAVPPSLRIINRG